MIRQIPSLPPRGFSTWGGAIALGILLLVAPVPPVGAQVASQDKLQSLQDQMFEFLQTSDYPGVLAVVREIRSLGTRVPESVLYAEGLSLLAIGRAQEAAWLLGNHLDQSSPDSLLYQEIQELHTTAQQAAAGTAGGTGAAAVESPAAAAGADQSAVGDSSTLGTADQEVDTSRAQPPTGPLPPNIATEWELENNPDARDWTRIRYSEDPQIFARFVERYPQSRFVSVAQQRQASLVQRLGRRGYEAYRSGDYAAARQTWETAANYGNDYAQTMLGFLHDQGLGVPQDSTEAHKWFEMAASQGNVTAQTNLGVLYYEGRGVPQDSRRALEYLLQGAESGDEAAQFRLGTLYQYGRGNVPQNLTEARRWFALAAEQGNAEAAAQLRLLSNQ